MEAGAASPADEMETDALHEDAADEMEMDALHEDALNGTDDPQPEEDASNLTNTDAADERADGNDEIDDEIPGDDPDEDDEANKKEITVALAEGKKLRQIYRENDARYGSAGRKRIGHDDLLRVKKGDDGQYHLSTKEEGGRIMAIIAWWLYKVCHLT